jgi:hypothetical protein
MGFLEGKYWDIPRMQRNNRYEFGRTETSCLDLHKGHQFSSWISNPATFDDTGPMLPWK